MGGRRNMQMVWNERAQHYSATKGDVMMLIQVEAKKFGETNRSLEDCRQFCKRMAELGRGLE